jgi:hypothetical protein
MCLASSDDGEEPAAAVDSDVVVIPASEDSEDEPQSQQQQQQQQAVQCVDLLSQSPLGKPRQQQQQDEADTGADRQQQQQQLPLVPAVGSGLPDCRSAPGFMAPSGLACLTLPLSPLALLELLRQVRGLQLLPFPMPLPEGRKVAKCLVI